ncbi:MAG: hypothetical protein OQK82_02165 [Candidatus Pacearchaeota archaeon]|nr:hypothetical protein [Candidatus Pacearchaeota archaeon]
MNEKYKIVIEMSYPHFFSIKCEGITEEIPTSLDSTMTVTSDEGKGGRTNLKDVLDGFISYSNKPQGILEGDRPGEDSYVIKIKMKKFK